MRNLKLGKILNKTIILIVTLALFCSMSVSAVVVLVALAEATLETLAIFSAISLAELSAEERDHQIEQVHLLKAQIFKLRLNFLLLKLHLVQKRALTLQDQKPVHTVKALVLKTEQSLTLVQDVPALALFVKHKTHYLVK